MSSIPVSTVRPIPHVFRRLTTGALYHKLAFAMVPACLLLLFQLERVQSLRILAVWAGVFLTDVVLGLITKSENWRSGNGFYLATVSALLIPPIDAWWIVVAVVAVVVAAKWAFGGLGRYWMHPALVAYVVTALAAPEPAVHSVELLPAEWERVLIDWLSRPVLEPFNLNVPQGYLSLFGGVVVLVLIGGVYILAHDLITVAVPVAGGLSFLLGTFLVVGAQLPGPTALERIATTPIALVLLFVATEPAIIPHNPLGRGIYGIVLGCAAALAGTVSPHGVVYGAFLATACVPIIDRLTTKVVY